MESSSARGGKHLFAARPVSGGSTRWQADRFDSRARAQAERSNSRSGAAAKEAEAAFSSRPELLSSAAAAAFRGDVVLSTADPGGRVGV